MIRLSATHEAAAGPDGRNSHQRGAPTPLAILEVPRAAAGHRALTAETTR